MHRKPLQGEISLTRSAGLGEDAVQQPGQDPLGAASAERIGINVTDLNCLNMLALKGHMTAGELARETGLTTASITGVLDIAPVFAPVIAACVPWRRATATTSSG